MIVKRFRVSILIGPLVILLGLGFAPGITHAATAVFNFDADTLGTATPFTDTNNGLSATFSSSGDPGGFEIVTSTSFSLLTGNLLLDPGPANLNNLNLTITFSLPVLSFSTDFALNTSDTTIPIQGSAFDGGSPVGGFTAAGAIPTGGFVPEGTATFVSASAFNKVTLSSTAPDFAVDNITVQFASTAVPEPAMLLLLGFGLLGLVGYGRKKFLKK